MGLVLVLITGLSWFDSLAAVVLGVAILVSGALLMRRSLSGLMDETDPQYSRRVAEVLDASVRSGLISDYHQLRVRRANDQMWVEVHLLLPGDSPISQAHDRATRVEQSLQSCLPEFHVWVTSHMEPSDHESAHPHGHPEMTDPLEHLRSAGR